MDDLEQFRQVFKDHADQDARNFADMKKSLDEIKQMQIATNLKLDPILDVYRSVVLSRGFVMGFAGVIVALGAIAAGVSWIINQVVQK